MLDETRRVIDGEAGVPDAVGIEHRVRSVEARTETTTRRDEDMARSTRDELALDRTHDVVTAAKTARGFSRAARVRANEQVS